jgi:hypothetical protein
MHRFWSSAPCLTPHERDERQAHEQRGRDGRARAGRRAVEPPQQHADLPRAEVGHDRGRAGRDHEQHDPREEEGGEAPEGLAQVDEPAAGAREGRGQLGEGHRAGDGDEPAEQPDREEGGWLGQQARDAAGREEDPHADHAAHDEHGRVEERELPGGGGFRAGHPHTLPRERSQSERAHDGKALCPRQSPLKTWKLGRQRDGQVSGGNELMLFLDRDCGEAWTSARSSNTCCPVVCSQTTCSADDLPP